MRSRVDDTGSSQSQHNRGLHMVVPASSPFSFIHFTTHKEKLHNFQYIIIIKENISTLGFFCEDGGLQEASACRVQNPLIQ